MRMWMINPKKMCNQHLLGEHGEIHKFRHNFVKKHKMGKRIELGQIDHIKMGERHNELAEEMVFREMNHQSPYESPDVSYLGKETNIDLEENIRDLSDRCEKCKKRIEEYL